MGVTMHKLSAGAGYTYLTKQVARSDLTATNGQTLADYYSEKGEQPGQWWGSALRGLGPENGVTAGQIVTEDQMKALFGEGLHPNADAITAASIDAGEDHETSLARAQLGTKFTDPSDTATPFIQGVTREYIAWLKAAGLPRTAPIPDEVRATIRTQVGRSTFVEQYGRDPLDARELSAHITRSSRPAKTTVAGYDYTFSAPKSFTVLWATATPERRQELQQVHEEAVTEALQWLEAEGIFTRRGKAGVRQVPTTGLIATRFNHRDTRDGDPHLHTHVAVSAKVQDPADGKWLALDGQPIHKLNVPLSERYNRLLEAKSRRLGYTWSPRPGTGTDGKRLIREIEGVPVPVIDAMSSRKAAIDAKLAQLATAFTTRNFRPPTTKEMHKLHRIAHEQTRAAKAEPRSLAEQIQEWNPRVQHALATAGIGGAATIAGMHAAALAAGEAANTTTLREKMTARDDLSPADVQRYAAAVVATVSGDRATFDASHLRSETDRVVRTLELSETGQQTAFDQIITAATGTKLSVRLDAQDPVVEPAALTYRGRSVYARAFSEQYTTAAVLDAEQDLLTLARTDGGRVVDERTVELALLEHAANNRFALNTGQAQLVRDMATSGARLQLALAPAGTGKTTAMSVLTRAWRDSGGTVLGLAPSAAAAEVLGESIDTDADTLAKLIWHIDGKQGQPPEWFAQIGPGSLVLIDEAGMAGTTDLAKAAQWVTARGGSVRLIGDDQQLAAVAAGGVLRNIAADVGALTLSEVVRFTTPGEAAATLAWRAGDPEALGFYLDQGRVSVGTETNLPDLVFDAWNTARGRGDDALMMAATHTVVDQLNARARHARLDGQAPAGPEVRLRGTSDALLSASAGDTIVTRKNNRRIRLGGTKFVKNGDRWTVQTVRADGSITARHTTYGKVVHLGADYVAEHVDLGYAATFHGAQGQTVTAGYPILTGAEDRQSAYVAITRGTDDNRIFTPVGGDGDDHKILHPDTVVPPTAVENLHRVIARDGSPVSATTLLRDEHDPVNLLARSAERYADALGCAAEQVAGPDKVAAIAAAAEQLVPGVTKAPAWDTLATHLLLLDMDGADTTNALAQAATERALTGAKDVAAVLDWRLDPTGHRTSTPGPVPWMPGTPRVLREHPTHGPWLAARGDLVAHDADQVVAAAGEITPEQAAPWQQALLDVPDLHGKVAVWRAVHRIDPADPTPTGPPRLSLRERAYQDTLTTAVHQHTGKAGTAHGAQFVEQLTQHAPAVLADSHWLVIAERLDVAAAAGRDVPAMIATALAIPSGGTGPVGRPLPDEHAAAALWSRILPQLGATTASDVITGSRRGRLRTPWDQALRDALPDGLGDRVITDPAWPTLVATVGAVARTTGWAPERVITTAAGMIPTGDLPTPGQVEASAGAIGLHELTPVLTWRVSDLLAPPSGDPAADQDQVVAEHDFADPDIDAFLSDLAAHHHDEALRDTSGQAAPPGVVGVAGVVPTTEQSHEPDPPTDDSEPDYYSEQDYAADQDYYADLAASTAAHDQSPRNTGQAGAANPSPQPPEQYGHTPVFTGTAQPLPEPVTDTSKARIIELNTAAAAFYADRYPGSPAAEHIRSRFGTDLTETAFLVGYAPGGWRDLTNHLRRTERATDTELVDANLAVWNKRGLLMDTFRDRAMVAIRDPYHGHVVAFTGRDLTDQSPARHKNTATTPAFRKGNQLFGVYEGRAMAKTAGAPRHPAPARGEGAFDAIALTLAGNHDLIGVSTLGTALTDYQADLIAGQARDHTVWTALDTDHGGYTATTNTIREMSHRWTTVRALELPGASDPAELWENTSDLLHAVTSAAAFAELAAVHVGYAIATGKADDPHHPDDRPVTQRVADIIAELPVDQWDRAIEDLAADVAATHPAAGVADVVDHTRNQLWLDTIATKAGVIEPPTTPAARATAAEALDNVNTDLHAIQRRTRTRDPEAAQRMERARQQIAQYAANRNPQHPTSTDPATEWAQRYSRRDPRGPSRG